MAKPFQQKTVVITGCDVPNSYGYELALCLDKQGYTVFAGCSDCNSIGARSLATRGSTRLAILQIDVTKQEEIDDAKDMIQDLVGAEGVWAVVNCAESYAVAEADWFANEDFDQIMQVNFLGTVRVIKALLPLLRKARGRVVNLSSISGCVSRAGQAAFAASKFALEAFSDALRQEMRKWGVYVSLVQPAFFPEGHAVLSDTEISVRLKRVPKETWDLYGEEYFSNYIQSFNGSRSSNVESSPLICNSISSASSSGYSSLSSTQSSLSSSTKKNTSELKQRRKKSAEFCPSKISEAEKTTPGKKEEIQKRRSFSTLSSSASFTFRTRGTVGLTNVNRVLHALVEAVTTQSPKVRYFVGSFQDRIVKTVSPMLPTVFVDTYFTSGEMSKVVPKHLKEKLE